MKIYSSYKEGRLTLFLQGEIDHHEVRKTMQQIERLLDEHLPRDCTIDLSELEFTDSSGIALILKIYRRMIETGGRAWVENACGQPLKVLDASGIERIIKISVSREA